MCGQVAGIKRNPVTYSVAISGCLRNGEPRRGLSLFEQMLERSVGTHDNMSESGILRAVTKQTREALDAPASAP